MIWWWLAVASAHDLSWLGLEALPDVLEGCEAVHSDEPTDTVVSVTFQCPEAHAITVMRVAPVLWAGLPERLDAELAEAAGVQQAHTDADGRSWQVFGTPVVARSTALERAGTGWWLSCVAPDADIARCDARLAVLLDATPPVLAPPGPLSTPGLVGQ